MKELYISDLDGTLANSKGIVSRRTIYILNKHIDSGVNFTIATARSLNSVSSIIVDLDLRLPVILHNGAYIHDFRTGKNIDSKLISSQTGKAVIQVFQSHGHNPLIYTDSILGNKVFYWEYQSEQQKEYIQYRRSNGDDRFVEIDSYNNEDDVISVVAIGEKATLEKIERTINDRFTLCVVLSQDAYDGAYWLEITHEHATKRSGAEYLRNRHGYDFCIGFGDNKNDIELFQSCEERVAVKNAVPELKALSDTVIDGNDDDAVARYIDMRESERSSSSGRS